MSYPSISRITPEDYQDRLTNIYGHNTSISCCCKGLLDGTKEVIELLNKDSDTRLADLILELGGVIASACLLGSTLGVSFEDILLAHINKLEGLEEDRNLEGTGSDR